MPRPTSTFRLAVTGGGTGSHTYPALTAIDALQTLLREQQIALDVTWYGTACGPEARVAEAHHITFRPLAAGMVRRSLKPGALARTLLDMLKVPFGVLQGTAALAASRPEAVLSTGGYVAVPLGLAARLTGRRLITHEQTTTLGLGNRVLARGARAVALTHRSSLPCLPGHVQERAHITGNPVRAELWSGDRIHAQRVYHLEWDLPLVYVTAGARGDARISELVAHVLPDVLTRCQVLYQHGPRSSPELEAAVAQLPDELLTRYHPVTYLDGDLAHVLAAADLVVARAGAGTVAELTAVGRASILIPVARTAGDEQRRNARKMADAGAAVTLADTGATAALLREAVLELLADPLRRQRMRAAAKELGQPDAAQLLAHLILSTARGQG